MSDKTKELNRINEPRVRRILDQLTFIEKSAASLRTHELDMARLLAPVHARLAELLDDDAIAEVAPAPIAPVEVAATPPVAREMGDLQDLTTQQLVDRMIACGAMLAERRK